MSEQKKDKHHSKPGEDPVETWSLLGEKKKDPPEPVKPPKDSVRKQPPVLPEENAEDPPRADIKKESHPPAKDMVACPLCGKQNEKDREFCWACFTPMNMSVDQDPSGPIIRKSYLFVPDDSIAPPVHEPVTEQEKSRIDIDYQSQAEHEDRIKTRTGEEVIKLPRRDIQIFKGSHLIAVRIDGKNYTSEDANIPIEARMIIRRVEAGESVGDIIGEVRDGNLSAHNGRKAQVSRRRKQTAANKIAGNYSTIIIVALILIFLFQLLFILKQCG